MYFYGPLEGTMYDDTESHFKTDTLYTGSSGGFSILYIKFNEVTEPRYSAELMMIWVHFWKPSKFYSGWDNKFQIIR